MDILTLAMAKAHTDQKAGHTASGLEVIDFDELGLTNTIFTLFAEGGGEKTIEATDAIRDIFSKPYNGNLVGKVSLSEAMELYMSPMSVRTKDGHLSAVFMEGYTTVDMVEVKLRVTFRTITYSNGVLEYVDIGVGILQQ